MVYGRIYMQANSGTIPNAFRLFELIFLILSVVAILLQSMVNYYSNRGIRVSTLKKGGAFVAVLFGVVAFVFAGNEIIGLFARKSVNQTIVTAAKAVLFGLGAVIIGLIIMLTDVLGDDQQEIDRTENSEETTDEQTRTPQVRRRIVEYETRDDQEEQEETDSDQNEG